ncbi:hypothetical protein JCM19236_1533 [Vibrio sp. JCM 19236]|nr:hypothetical protein JCM19236_1533 [Vibrio sp. JCM 19236]
MLAGWAATACEVAGCVEQALSKAISEITTIARTTLNLCLLMALH